MYIAYLVLNIFWYLLICIAAYTAMPVLFTFKLGDCSKQVEHFSGKVVIKLKVILFTIKGSSKDGT